MSQIFSYQENPVRTHTENNETWFVAKDVCKALSITWGAKTLAAIPESWQGVVKLPTPCGSYKGGGKQTLRTINEAATYKLAFRSNKPQADAFTNWVASEVLPAIRKTGKYEAAPKPKRKALPPAGPSLEERINGLMREAMQHTEEIKRLTNEMVMLLGERTRYSRDPVLTSARFALENLNRGHEWLLGALNMNATQIIILTK